MKSKGTFLVVKIPRSLLARFKRVCVRQDLTMSQKIRKFMRKEIENG
jgi:antitoxin component of RelBE/YafQ-DinJ toxin-antitoxin module